MKLFDKLFAVLLIFTAAVWACLAAARAYDRSPDWWGVLTAIGTLVLGVHITISIGRDRL